MRTRRPPPVPNPPEPPAEGEEAALERQLAAQAAAGRRAPPAAAPESAGAILARARASGMNISLDESTRHVAVVYHGSAAGSSYVASELMAELHHHRDEVVRILRAERDALALAPATRAPSPRREAPPWTEPPPLPPAEDWCGHVQPVALRDGVSVVRNFPQKYCYVRIAHVAVEADDTMADTDLPLLPGEIIEQTRIIQHDAKGEHIASHAGHLIAELLLRAKSISIVRPALVRRRATDVVLLFVGAKDPQAIGNAIVLGPDDRPAPTVETPMPPPLPPPKLPHALGFPGYTEDDSTDSYGDAIDHVDLAALEERAANRAHEQDVAAFGGGDDDDDDPDACAQDLPDPDRCTSCGAWNPSVVGHYSSCQARRR